MKIGLFCLIVVSFATNGLSRRPSRSPSQGIYRRQADSPSIVTKPGCSLNLDHYDCNDGTKCIQTDGKWVCHAPDGTPQNPDGSAFAEPATDTPTCGTESTESYNLPLHIASVFVILAASLVGVAVPLAAQNFSKSPIFGNIFFVIRHFGTGIIISTAFVHLLFSASETFSNPCLTGISFAPAAQSLAMGGVYAVFLIDFFALRYLTRRSANVLPTTINPDNSDLNVKGDGSHRHDFAHDHHMPHGTVDYSSAQAHFDVSLLEAGIIFHSVMVGVTIGATQGDGYIPLLIAIVFHQLFEGLGLGSRIALLIFRAGDAWKKWVMGAAFAVTTPIGIAIGIGVRFSFKPNSQEALLATGILDGFSAGILLYAGLVELLAHDYMREDLCTASNIRVAIALIALFSGTALMSLLGNWA